MRLSHVAAIERAELLAFLRRDLAVEHTRFPAAQLALDLARRAGAQQHHEKLLVRRQLALLAAVAERAGADRAGPDLGLQDVVPAEAGVAQQAGRELGGRQGLVGFGAAQRFEGFDEGGAVEGGHKPTCKEVSVTSYKI